MKTLSAARVGTNYEYYYTSIPVPITVETFRHSGTNESDLAFSTHVLRHEAGLPEFDVNNVQAGEGQGDVFALDGSA
eukprot:COSAG02_NODE_32_length_50374_cov_46.674013_8_plen_77_part_00